ncbi:MAG: CoB--CoM heterodisulfide reductase iron-sulfur subunit B family protein, partial [Planctomycetes bacterium]|nr:CoB--CoM heterodisulfide reductase iron-sulfur subunit B family protein [Planctomycetota bacterium]
NLALAEPYERDVLTPCNACFTVLSKTNRYFKEMPEVKEKVGRALAAAGLAYRGTVKVRHVLDAFVNDVGLEEVARRVVAPLGGLKVACYYGCQIVRPETGLDSADYPVILDRFFEAMGAAPVPFSLKARCCGASLIVSREDVALDLIADILKCAADSGAEAIATVCPMCHINLETQMQRINAQRGTDFSMPVVYFTQLAGVALGADAGELGLEKGFLDPRPLLERRTAAGARG